VRLMCDPMHSSQPICHKQSYPAELPQPPLQGQGYSSLAAAADANDFQSSAVPMPPPTLPVHAVLDEFTRNTVRSHGLRAFQVLRQVHSRITLLPSIFCLTLSLPQLFHFRLRSLISPAHLLAPLAPHPPLPASTLCSVPVNSLAPAAAIFCSECPMRSPREQLLAYPRRQAALQLCFCRFVNATAHAPVSFHHPSLAPS
jgi:hypothetical protein